MDTLNDIFCFVMAGLFLPVGPACSGARTFIGCEILAFFLCLLFWGWHWKMFVFAAAASLICNIVRCAILLIWIYNDLPYFALAHDLISWTCVGGAFVATALYYPRRKIHA